MATRREKLEQERIKQVVEAREAKKAAYTADPYLGFPTLSKAIEAYKGNSQAEALARLLARENIFISGLAGSGKTTVIRRFMEMMDAEFEGSVNIALTATTGIAATLIEGRTIHSWSGLGLGDKPFDAGDLPKTYWARRNEIRETDVLVIDEVSMLPAYLFTNLDKMLQFTKKNKKPFGGIQLVLIGDFLQLPVVSRPGDELDTRFVIQTDEWKKADIKCLFLDKSYRAKDNRLTEVLREVSRGSVTSKSMDMLADRMGLDESVFDKQGKVYTVLHTTNKNVDAFNKQKLDEQPGAVRLLKSVDKSGKADDIAKAYKMYNIPEFIELKVGATVMLTKNVSSQDGEMSYANGSLGKITKIEPGFGSIQVQLNSGDVVWVDKYVYSLTEKKSFTDSYGKTIHFESILAEIEQFPLKLAYAITVHKSQGQTFDGVVVDLSKCFQPGLGYVALSRVRNLDDIVIKAMSSNALHVSPVGQTISKVVKTRAVESRKEFIEKIDDYDMMLSDPTKRGVYWETGRARKY